MEFIEELFADECVTDVIINGPGDVWVDRGKGMEKVDLCNISIIQSPDDVKSLALFLARQAQARLDDASPITDTMIKMSSGVIRMNAVIFPLVHRSTGALISLRKPARKVWSLGDLVKKEMLTDEQSERLKYLVGQKKSIIISGATGSGKTTLLSALLQEVPHNERILGIEEAPELSNTVHPGLALMNAREANIEGVGEVKLARLLKATLRMRPDRILLGECRGEEVREFLLALGSGFAGSFTTIHADSAGGVRGRIETLAFMSGVYTKLAKSQFDQYIDVIVHVRKSARGRYVEEILERDSRKYRATGLEQMGVLDV